MSPEAYVNAHKILLSGWTGNVLKQLNKISFEFTKPVTYIYLDCLGGDVSSAKAAASQLEVIEEQYDGDLYIIGVWVEGEAFYPYLTFPYQKRLTVIGASFVFRPLNLVGELQNISTISELESLLEQNRNLRKDYVDKVRERTEFPLGKIGRILKYNERFYFDDKEAINLGVASGYLLESAARGER